MRPTLNERSSGVLLHPTSLPGPGPCGDLGPPARRWIDFLASAGQRWWQMLPVEPTGYGASPYQAISAFAGNPLLISVEWLAEQGLAGSPKARPSGWRGGESVDYVAASCLIQEQLEACWARFKGGARRDWRGRFASFRARHSDWLDDFALFCVLREQENGPWHTWSPELRKRDLRALDRVRYACEDRVAYHAFVQFLFDLQWAGLRDHCGKKDVGLIGDAPFFVAQDSADVWAHPELFRLDGEGRPLEVAGVPPDYFSRNGQLWGNPLYRWEALRRTGYGWWVRRLRRVLERFDAVRLDHFIGFHRSWAVRPAARTARQGRFVPGPGIDFFQKVKRRIGALPFIAEDLGVVTPEVRALRSRLGFPGIRVLQFAFGDPAGASEHLPHRHETDCVVYPGTHDNDTAIGWYTCAARPGAGGKPADLRLERRLVREYLGTDGRQIHWDLIRAAMNSTAGLAIVPAQDILGLGNAARMNEPGTAEGNWVWRMRADAADAAIADRLARMTALSGRSSRSRWE